MFASKQLERVLVVVALLTLVGGFTTIAMPVSIAHAMAAAPTSTATSVQTIQVVERGKIKHKPGIQPFSIYSVPCQNTTADLYVEFSTGYYECLHGTGDLTLNNITYIYNQCETGCPYNVYNSDWGMWITLQIYHDTSYASPGHTFTHWV